MSDTIETARRVLPSLARRHREAFAKQLVKARERERWSQAELAHRIGVDASHISHYENGRRAPSFESLVSLSNVLGVSLDELCGFQRSGFWAQERARMVARIRELADALEQRS